MWNDYINDRLIKDLDEYYIIKPKDASEPIPLNCPVCEGLYRDRLDEVSHIEFQCCNKCAMKWAHCNRKRWESGWRPTSSDVRSAISERPNIRVVIDMD